MVPKGRKTAPARGHQNQPKAPQWGKWRRVLRTILFKNHCFLHWNAVFLVLERTRVDLGSFLKRRQKFNFSSKFWYFWLHIFSTAQGFLSSNRPHIKPAQSSSIVWESCTGVSQFIKYFYQKYGVKESKSCTSAGTPKSAEGAAVRKVKESASHHLFKNQWILHENAVFLVLGRFRVDLRSFLKKR